MNIDKRGNPVNVMCEHLEIKHECEICNPVFDKEAIAWVKQNKLKERLGDNIRFFDGDTFEII